MSILIRGMEMPTNCDKCWALDDYGDYPRCRITEEQRGYNFPIREKRMNSCPLVPVPTPRGRLGDLDALYSHIKEEQKTCDSSYECWTECQVALGFVTGASTIIPASEEGE